MTDEVEDERAKQEGICGVTKVVGQTEWICVKQVHGKVYKRRKSSGRNRKGALIFDDRTLDAHYFVNRWPQRSRGER